MAYVSFDIFASGYTQSEAVFINPIQGKGKKRFYATWALIQHPQKGYILFDTGYAPRFYDATSYYPNNIQAYATPVTIDRHQSATALLQQQGIKASDIQYVIISHFHADHVAGLLDFGNATIITSQAAADEVFEKKGIEAVRKGIITALLPTDLKQRLWLIEQHLTSYSEQKTAIPVYDIWGDGSMELLSLPGHARGHIGLRLQTQQGRVLLASDAAYDYDAFVQQILPLPIMGIVFDNTKEYEKTFARLYVYHRCYPNEPILFCHCPKTLDRVKNKQNLII